VRAPPTTASLTPTGRLWKFFASLAAQHDALMSHQVTNTGSFNQQGMILISRVT
jgi:hypothetical protein